MQNPQAGAVECDFSRFNFFMCDRGHGDNTIRSYDACIHSGMVLMGIQ